METPLSNATMGLHPPPPPRSKAPDRTTRDGPFAWWNKAAVRHIRNICDPCEHAIRVYLALCEISSNKASQNFMASLSEIGSLSGVKRRNNLCEAIRQLEFVGLVEVNRSRLRMASAFRMLGYDGTDNKYVDPTHE